MKPERIKISTQSIHCSDSAMTVRVHQFGCGTMYPADSYSLWVSQLRLYHLWLPLYGCGTIYPADSYPTRVSSQYHHLTIHYGCAPPSQLMDSDMPYANGVAWSKMGKNVRCRATSKINHLVGSGIAVHWSQSWAPGDIWVEYRNKLEVNYCDVNQGII